MNLDSAKYMKESGQKVRHLNSETGWPEVSQGLKLVILGYVALVSGTVLGLLVVWLAVGEHPFLEDLLPTKVAVTLLPFGIMTLLLTAGISYTLVLLGQWSCLLHAPQRQGAKELMLICFYCVVVCSALSLIGTLTGGQDLYGALRRAELDKLNVWGFGVMLLLGSGLLGLAASLVFSQFLRTLACCFGDLRRARHIDFNLIFVSLMIGGSAGAVICFWQFAPQVTLLPWLVGGWLLCFAWHLVLIVAIRRCISQGLRSQSGVRQSISPELEPGGPKMHSLSGLRRLMEPPA